MLAGACELKPADNSKGRCSGCCCTGSGAAAGQLQNYFEDLPRASPGIIVWPAAQNPLHQTQKSLPSGMPHHVLALKDNLS